MKQGKGILPRECTGHRKHPLPITQEKTLHMDITRWLAPKSDWSYSLQPKMEKLNTVSKTRPGADYGSDHELLIVIFRLKLKKEEKSTRPFRYYLNQIPYDYTVEVRNGFMGLDIIDRVPDEWWTEVHDIVQETGIKTIPKKKKCKKAKWMSEKALQRAVKRRDARKSVTNLRWTPHRPQDKAVTLWPGTQTSLVPKHWLLLGDP